MAPWPLSRWVQDAVQIPHHVPFFVSKCRFCGEILNKDAQRVRLAAEERHRQRSDLASVLGHSLNVAT